MSGNRSDLVLIDDILESIDQILLYTKGMAMRDFLADRLVQLHGDGGSSETALINAP